MSSAIFVLCCVPSIALPELAESIAGVPPFVLTRAMIEDILASLDLWYVLASHKGAMLLSSPRTMTKLQQAMCQILDTVAFLPLNQSAIARLSTAPVDPAEACLAEEPTTTASEALLGLQQFWFWVSSICKSGACPGALQLLSRLTPLRADKMINGLLAMFLRKRAVSITRMPLPHILPACSRISGDADMGTQKLKQNSASRQQTYDK